MISPLSPRGRHFAEAGAQVIYFQAFRGQNGSPLFPMEWFLGLPREDQALDGAPGSGFLPVYRVSV